MRVQSIVILVVLVSLVAGFSYWRSGKAGSASAGGRPARAISVELIPVRIGDAPVQITAIGQITSSHSVAIRPQVSGLLTHVFFEEGQTVQKGDRLFEIDSAPYRAALAQAQAQLASAQAAAEAAEAQLQRLLPLADKGYVNAQELLAAKASAEQSRAGVALAAAAVASAQISVDQSLIRAPISGRTGSIAVKAGNLVTANESTVLVTINQLQPVQAEFTVPQTQLTALQAAMAAGPVAIQVGAQTGGPTLAEGRLLFVDNTIDPSTGTVKLKAEFANADEALWPGTFVSFTATLGIEKARVLVPEIAVQPGAEGSFVYVVGEDYKVQLTPVTIVRQVGRDVVIGEGLKGDERIVGRVPRDLNPGAAVQEVGAAKKQARPATPKAATP